MGMGFGATLVTGGAGFIGSYIVERLVSNGIHVKVYDNLSSGTLSNLVNCLDEQNFAFIKGDLNDQNALQNILHDVKTVFHIAAYPEVRTGFTHPEICFTENIRNTFNLLEQIRNSKVENIFFSSSSTVYGEPTTIPTPENYGPLLPISQYGSSKLACEALISSYCNTYGIRSQIFRFANVIGKRSNHGVIWDFITKLSQCKKELEVLGDGTQSKSYLHINDCIDAIFFCSSNMNKQVEIFNLGNDDEIDVKSIANVVCKTMHLDDVDINVSGGVDGGRGWIGDIKKMNLDISKIKALGWTPKLSSVKAVKLAAEEIIKDMKVITIGH